MGAAGLCCWAGYQGLDKNHLWSEKPVIAEKQRVFTARAEIIPDNIGAVVTARVTEISLHGCYLDFIQLRQGSHVLLKIFARGDCVEAKANVVYSQEQLGTALGFTSVEAHSAEVLKKWVHEEAPI